MRPNIAAIIGWKFGDQEGMETGDGEITKFPGGIPSQSQQDIWAAEYEKHLTDAKYITQRKQSIVNGGYGTLQEQFEILGKQGIVGYQKHFNAVRARYIKPKP